MPLQDSHYPEIVIAISQTPKGVVAHAAADAYAASGVCQRRRNVAMGPKPPGLNLGLKEDELVQLISLVDADRDGVITLKEFITSLSKSTVLEDFVGRIKRMEHDGLRNRVLTPLKKELQALG